MSDINENEPVRCGVCGEIVGVYEPAAFVTPDGRCVMGSQLTVSPTPGAELSVSHAACWNGTSSTTP